LDIQTAPSKKADWNGSVLEKAGDYHIDNKLTVPNLPGAEVEVLAGTLTGQLITPQPTGDGPYYQDVSEDLFIQVELSLVSSATWETLAPLQVRPPPWFDAQVHLYVLIPLSLLTLVGFLVARKGQQGPLFRSRKSKWVWSGLLVVSVLEGAWLGAVGALALGISLVALILIGFLAFGIWVNSLKVKS